MILEYACCKRREGLYYDLPFGLQKIERCWEQYGLIWVAGPACTMRQPSVSAPFPLWAHGCPKKTSRGLLRRGENVLGRGQGDVESSNSLNLSLPRPFPRRVWTRMTCAYHSVTLESEWKSVRTVPGIPAVYRWKLYVLWYSLYRYTVTSFEIL